MRAIIRFCFKMLKTIYIRMFKTNLHPEYELWRSTNFRAPSPQNVKLEILISNSIPKATWIETGTYLGDTTVVLAKNANFVITIEPSERQYEYSLNRLKDLKNVKIINSTSEECIEEILENLSGPTCFWLDGHYSGGYTFMGSSVTPIFAELNSISNYLQRNRQVVIFIDDFRLFVDSSNTGYPSQNYLVDWANSHKLVWTVEQDIFIAKT